MSDNSENSASDLFSEDEVRNVKCIFCAHVAMGVDVISEHMVSVHNFNLEQTRKTFKLSFYECIGLINYLRKNYLNCNVFSGNKMEEIISTIRGNLEANLIPVIADDPLLYAFDEDDQDWDIDEEQYYAQDVVLEGTYNVVDEKNLLDKKLQKLTLENSQIKEEYAEYKRKVEASIKHMFEDSSAPVKPVKAEHDDAYYFDSYSHVDIHEDMLKDKVRTDAYRDFIYENKHLFKNKIVLDVGCGTGILSLFASRAGAKRVYAADNSDMLETAKTIAKLNRIENIEFFKGRMEELELPSKVDIIISEWMGYFLLFEGMLDSVLSARDKWLNPGGCVLPSHASIYLSAIEDEDWIDNRMTFWNNVYGFDMTPVRTMFKDDVIVDLVSKTAKDLGQSKVVEFDCLSVCPTDLDFVRELTLEIEKDGTIHAICGWFDVDFKPEGTYNNICMSTAPTSTPTHWKQAIMRLDEPLNVKSGDKLQMKLAAGKHAKNPRELSVNLQIRDRLNLSLFLK